MDRSPTVLLTGFGLFWRICCIVVGWGLALMVAALIWNYWWVALITIVVVVVGFLLFHRRRR